MILPGKDFSFEYSLLNLAIKIYKQIPDKISVVTVYEKYEKVNIQDLDVILVFLYCIGKIDIYNEEVVKI